MPGQNDQLIESGANSQIAVGLANTLTSFEVVLSEDDFFVSVNGQVLPSECSGFSLDENNCLVLHHEHGDVVSFPVPNEFLELVKSSDRILFVKFDNGVVVDGQDLTKEQYRGY